MTTRLSRLARRLFVAAAFAVPLAATATFAHADALDTVQKNGVLRVGVFMDYPPFGSIGPDMKPQGYDIEMADYLAKTMKVDARRTATAFIELFNMTNEVNYGDYIGTVTSTSSGEPSKLRGCAEQIVVPPG